MNVEQLFVEDMDFILGLPFIDWTLLENSSVLITGASGLIGSNLVKVLAHVEKKRNLGIKVVAFVHNRQKADLVFKDMRGSTCLEIVEGDIQNGITYARDIDYLIHCASPTSSSFFQKKPVEVIRTAIDGTFSALEFACVHKAKGFVYLSTMEVYGTPLDDGKIKEDHASNIDLLSPRSSYPESKRMCENLCASYYSEYGLKTDIIRLTQTFGPGVAYDDQRVFAQFARSAVQNEDIVLATAGRTKRCYLYTADAVSAILIVMLRSKGGEAYNAAREDSYCSIREMADLVLRIADNGKHVIIKDESKDKSFYAPELRMNLDVSRLRSLGWYPGYDLEEAYKRLICYMQSIKPE